MRKRYEINLEDSGIKEMLKEFDKEKRVNEFSSILSEIIESLSNENYTVFDAQKIMDGHFTDKPYDIFISHSHGDIDYVRKLAGYYEKQGKSVFIDSEYWDFSDKLLKQLDDEFSRIEGSTNFSYERRNITTTVVHNLLAVSLEKMIHECKYFVFAHSDKTAGSNLHELLEYANSSGKHTISPWIYKELITADIIYKNRPEYIEKSGETRSASPLFLYDIKELTKDYCKLDLSNMELN
ncbi:hypothetical protein [Staphylococcus xylosus]